jgi:hypothetical protein
MPIIDSVPLVYCKAFQEPYSSLSAQILFRSVFAHPNNSEMACFAMFHLGECKLMPASCTVWVLTRVNLGMLVISIGLAESKCPAVFRIQLIRNLSQK